MPVFFLPLADLRYFGHRWVTVSGILHSGKQFLLGQNQQGRALQ